MRHWDARLRRYTSIVFILMLGSAAVAFLFSSKLQTVISKPILDLERTIRTVSDNKNFALRAPKSHDDEVGVLIDGFNGMLSEIQRRDLMCSWSKGGRPMRRWNGISCEQ